MLQMLAKFIVFILLWIIFTPLIYAVHSFVNALLNSKKVNEKFALSSYERLDFPLAFAVLSGNEDMMKLFLDYGIPIDMKDNYNNNIIHYIADLSRFKYKHALHNYNILKRLTNTEYLTKDVLQNLINNDVNLHLQNPIEYACQHGSPQFASFLINDTMIKKLLCVSEDRVFIMNDGHTNSPRTSINYISTSSLNVIGDSDILSGNNTLVDPLEQLPTSGWFHTTMDVTPYSIAHR